MVFDKFGSYVKLSSNNKELFTNHTGGELTNPLELLKTDLHEKAKAEAAKLYPKLDDINPLQNIDNVSNSLTSGISDLKGKVLDDVNDLKGKAVDTVTSLKDEAVNTASQKLENIVTDSAKNVTSKLDEQLTGQINSQISKLPINDSEMLKALKIENTSELMSLVSDFKTFDLQEKIVEMVEKYFTTKTNGNLTEMREVFYKQIVDAITYHLQGPEGRQMFLRMIEPLVLLFAQQFILTGEIEIITIIHLVNHSTIIKTLLNEALMESIRNPLNADDITIRTVISFYEKLQKHKDSNNPLKELYQKMQNLKEPIPISIINKKIKLDYNKTLCSSSNDIQKQISRKRGGKLVRKSKKQQKSHSKKNKRCNITKKIKPNKMRRSPDAKR